MKVHRAKLLQNGGSQAVRLPRPFRFPRGQREVLVRRERDRTILDPSDAWPEQFRACLGAWRGEVERPPAIGIDALRDIGRS